MNVPLTRSPDRISLHSLLPVAKRRRLPRAGDWVEVRSKGEILATLDKQGRLDGLPFMPQMFRYCGQQFRVFKRSHKSCDTIYNTGGLRMKDAVLLQGLICDGAAYAACGASCYIIWKNAWLKPTSQSPNLKLESDSASRNPGCTEHEVRAATIAEDSTGSDPRYTCQTTELLKATEHLPWWDLRQYVEDITSRNVTVKQLAGGAAFAVARGVVNRLGYRFGIAPQLIGLYDKVQRWRSGVPYPRKVGTVPPGQRTPVVRLNLYPGEHVRVKCYDEILSTLDSDNKNRGMFFDAEEVPYCGRTVQVRNRVSRILDERNGRPIEIRGGGAVVLEGVICQGHYSHRRMFCPRAVHSFWRESWLEREGNDHFSDAPPSGPVSLPVPRGHSSR